MSEAAAVVPAAVPAPAAPVATPPVEIPPAVLERERQVRALQERTQAIATQTAKDKAEVDAWKAERAKEADAKADPLEKIEKATNRLATLEQSIKAKETQAALVQWQQAKIAEVKAKPDAYELTILRGWEHEVPRRIEEHWNRTGEMLSTEEVANKVEKELEAEVEKAVGSKKWKAKTAPAAPPPPAAPAQQAAPKGREAPKTLTNALGGTQTTPPAEGSKKLSAAERKAAVLAKWEAREKAAKQ